MTGPKSATALSTPERRSMVAVAGLHRGEPCRGVAGPPGGTACLYGLELGGNAPVDRWIQVAGPLVVVDHRLVVGDGARAAGGAAEMIVHRARRNSEACAAVGRLYPGDAA